MNDQDVQDIKLVIKNLITYLKDKNLILSGEVSHFLNAILYLIKHISINKHELVQNLKKIKDGTIGLKEQLAKQLKKIEAIESNTKLDLVMKFIVLDCVRKRLVDLSNDLEYLTNGYSSIVDGYESNHKDIIPNITRRFNTTNLHFYYNKKIKENYKKMKSQYFECELDEDDDKAIFSTWSYSAQEHVKTIFIEDEKIGKFIAMNFWFLERPLAFSIVNHELSHIIYMMQKHKYKIKKNKNLESIIQNIEKAAFLEKGNSKITKNFIKLIYQEIHCDLAAYSLDGVGYFYALFFTIMLGDISNSFFEDSEEVSIYKEKFLKISDYQCLKQNLQYREWVKKSTNISIYVRLKILLDLIKHSKEYKQYLKYIKKHSSDNKKNPYFEYRLINGIDKIISLIYHDDNNFQANKIPTLAHILKNHQKIFRSYKIVNNYTQFLYKLFKINFIDIKDKKLRFKIKNISKDDQSSIKDIIKWRENDLTDIDIQKISEEKTIDTLLWRYRILSLINKDREFINRTIRRFAMQSTLNLEIEKTIKPKEATCELISFNFQGRGLISSENEKITTILKELFPRCEISYNFDIYEMSVIVKHSSRRIDDLLYKLYNEYSFNYMITRYVLFKLETNTIDRSNTHIVTMFIKIGDREAYCNQFVQDYKDIKNKNSNKNFVIYKSIGSEDFIVKIYTNSFDDLYSSVDEFKKLKYLRSLEYVYGITDINKIENHEDFKLRVYLKYKDVDSKIIMLNQYRRVELSNYFHECIEIDNIKEIQEILESIKDLIVETKFEIVKIKKSFS